MSGSESDAAGRAVSRAVPRAVPRAARPAVPRLHVITDDRVLALPDLVAICAGILTAGAEREGLGVALHLRGPRTDGRTLYRIATAVRRAHPEGDPGGDTPAAATLVVNDRVDVALAAQADAVQLGGRSLRPGELPRAAAALRVGVSVHGEEEVAAAGSADWLLAGTVFPTASHPGRPGVGARGVAAVVAASAAPVIAIGGITPQRVPEVWRAGAHGVAVLRGVWEAADPVAAVHRYLSELVPDPNPDPTTSP